MASNTQVVVSLVIREKHTDKHANETNSEMIIKNNSTVLSDSKHYVISHTYSEDAKAIRTQKVSHRAKRKSIIGTKYQEIIQYRVFGQGWDTGVLDNYGFRLLRHC